MVSCCNKACHRSCCWSAVLSTVVFPAVIEYRNDALVFHNNNYNYREDRRRRE